MMEICDVTFFFMSNSVRNYFVCRSPTNVNGNTRYVGRSYGLTVGKRGEKKKKGFSPVWVIVLDACCILKWGFLV